MKLILYMLCSILYVQGDENLEECLTETKANRNQVLKLKAGSWKKADATTKKWALCYLTKTGVMSSTGVLSQDVVLKDIPDKDKLIVEKVINKCLYQKRHVPTDTAWHYLTCFRLQMPKYAKIANRI